MLLNLQSIMTAFVGHRLFRSRLLCPFVWMESMCLCSRRRGRGKKELTVKKRKGRTERSLPLQRACLSSPFQAQEERKLGGGRRTENKEGEYGE